MKSEEYIKAEHELELSIVNTSIAKLRFELVKANIEIKELKEQIEEYKNSKNYKNNVLYEFLRSDFVKLDKDNNRLYCREKAFIIAFNDYCKSMHVDAPKWTREFYSAPFAEFGIKVLKNEHRRYPNKPGAEIFNGVCFIGVDLAINQ